MKLCNTTYISLLFVYLFFSLVPLRAFSNSCHVCRFYNIHLSVSRWCNKYLFNFKTVPLAFSDIPLIYLDYWKTLQYVVWSTIKDNFTFQILNYYYDYEVMQHYTNILTVFAYLSFSFINHLMCLLKHIPLW